LSKKKDWVENSQSSDFGRIKNKDALAA